MWTLYPIVLNELRFNQPTEVTLHIALDTYFSIKENNRNQAFFRHSKHYIDYSIQAITDKLIKYFTIMLQGLASIISIK